MDESGTTEWFDQPPLPLEQLHQQSLKNHDYALAALARLPDAEAEPLRKDLATWMRALETAYKAGDAVKHYRLDRQLVFEFMMKLNFTIRAQQKDPG